MNAPDFVIIGASKCGTSYLYRNLIKHPQVKDNKLGIKEIRFLTDKKLHNHHKELLKNFGDFEWYYSQFDFGDEYKSGEGSPRYFYDSVSPKLAQNLPNSTKFIAMVRCYYDALISNYFHVTQHNPQREKRSFEQMVRDEFNGKTRRYLWRRHYIERIQKWWDTIGKDRLLIVNFDEYKKDNIDKYNEILNFLDLETDVMIPKKTGKKTQYVVEMPDILKERIYNYYKPRQEKMYNETGIKVKII